MKLICFKGWKAPLVGISLLIGIMPQAQVARHPMNPTELSSVLDTVIQKRMERYHIPGFAVAIVRDGKLYWSRGYGFSEIETKRPVEPAKTIFRIGSITKLFTATAMLQMVDEKKIKLFDDINRYTDDKLIYRNGIPITLHHLLSHSEGFREIRGRQTSSAAKILPLEIFLKDRLVQDYSAGEIASYTTYGMALCGRLLERLSGMPYRKYLQKKLFDPLEMAFTNATDIPEKNKNYFATGYEYTNDSFKKMNFEYYQTYPASDINSTVNDMANFMIMHLNDGRFKNRVLLEPSTAKSMKMTQFRNHPEVVGFGYGFWESSINGTRAFYHGGVMDGYSSTMYLWPDKNLGIFMVSNREAPNFLSSVMNNFLYYFFPDPPSFAPVISSDISLKSNLARFAGKYQRIDGPILQIIANTDSTISFFGGRWAQVKPLLFQLTNGLLDTGEDLIAFKENEKGEIVWMTTGPFVYINLQNRHPPDQP